MATNHFNIKGGQELIDVLSKFPVKMETKIMRGMLVAFGRVIANEAKRLAPRETGDLRRSIRVSSRPPKNGKVIATVKAGGKQKGKPNIFYANMIEFGTKSYTITNYRRKRLYRNEIRQGIKKVDARRKALTIDGGLFAKADHPGITPKPFMRTAMDTQIQNALDASIKYARKRIEKEAKTLASRANRK